MDSVISPKRPDDYTASQGARFEVHYEKSRGFSGEAAKPFVVQLEESEGQYRWQSNSLEETHYQPDCLRKAWSKKILPKSWVSISPPSPGTQSGPGRRG